MPVAIIAHVPNDNHAKNALDTLEMALKELYPHDKESSKIRPIHYSYERGQYKYVFIASSDDPDLLCSLSTTPTITAWYRDALPSIKLEQVDPLKANWIDLVKEAEAYASDRTFIDSPLAGTTYGPRAPSPQPSSGVTEFMKALNFSGDKENTTGERARPIARSGASKSNVGRTSKSTSAKAPLQRQPTRQSPREAVRKDTIRSTIAAASNSRRVPLPAPSFATEVRQSPRAAKPSAATETSRVIANNKKMAIGAPRFPATTSTATASTVTAYASTTTTSIANPSASSSKRKLDDTNVALTTSNGVAKRLRNMALKRIPSNQRIEAKALAEKHGRDEDGIALIFRTAYRMGADETKATFEPLLDNVAYYATKLQQAAESAKESVKA